MSKQNLITIILVVLLIAGIYFYKGEKFQFSILPTGVNIPSNAIMANDWNVIFNSGPTPYIYSQSCKDNPSAQYCKGGLIGPYNCNYDYCQYRILNCNDYNDIKETIALHKGQSLIINYLDNYNTQLCLLEKDYSLQPTTIAQPLPIGSIPSTTTPSTTTTLPSLIPGVTGGISPQRNQFQLEPNQFNQMIPYVIAGLAAILGILLYI